MSTLTPTSSSILATYFLAFSGRSSNFSTVVISSVHPSNSSYIGSHLAKSSNDAGKSFIILSPILYAVHTCILSNPVKTFNNINVILVNQFTLVAYLTITVSTHPHLLAFPVYILHYLLFTFVSSSNFYSHF